jgi:hypothetical protein
LSTRPRERVKAPVASQAPPQAAAAAGKHHHVNSIWIRRAAAGVPAHSMCCWGVVLNLLIGRVSAGRRVRDFILACGVMCAYAILWQCIPQVNLPASIEPPKTKEKQNRFRAAVLPLWVPRGPDRRRELARGRPHLDALRGQGGARDTHQGTSSHQTVGTRFRNGFGSSSSSNTPSRWLHPNRHVQAESHRPCSRQLCPQVRLLSIRERELDLYVRNCRTVGNVSSIMVRNGQGGRSPRASRLVSGAARSGL